MVQPLEPGGLVPQAGDRVGRLAVDEQVRLALAAVAVDRVLELVLGPAGVGRPVRSPGSPRSERATFYQDTDRPNGVPACLEGATRRIYRFTAGRNPGVVE